MIRTIYAFLIAMAVLLAARPMLASEWITEEPNQHLNQVETEVHAVLDYGELGAGIRVGIPIVKQGFVSTINDNVAINFGADIVSWSSSGDYATSIVVPVMLQWNFYLTRDWSVFGEGGIAVQNEFTEHGKNEHQNSFAGAGFGIGGRYYFNPGNYPALILRLGYPSGLSVGVAF